MRRPFAGGLNYTFKQGEALVVETPNGPLVITVQKTSRSRTTLVAAGVPGVTFHLVSNEDKETGDCGEPSVYQRLLESITPNICEAV